MLIEAGKGISSFNVTPVLFLFLFLCVYGYRNRYQAWGHCGFTNDLWDSQVIGETTMTKIQGMLFYFIMIIQNQ